MRAQVHDAFKKRSVGRHEVDEVDASWHDGSVVGGSIPGEIRIAAARAGNDRPSIPTGVQPVAAGGAEDGSHDVAAYSVIKSVTPLLGLNIYSIFNLNDGSSLVGPAMTYSLATNLEIAASVYFFNGANDSEFGFQQTSYFAFLQYYF